MKNLFLLILAVSAMALFSCTGEGGSSTNKGKRAVTTSGYEYIHHVKNGGTTVQEGDKTFMHLVVTKNDSIELQSSYKMGRTFPQIIPPADKLQKPFPPTYEALMMMSEGDSLTIWQSLDSVPNLPQGFLPTDVIRFDVKLVEVQSKAEVEALMAAGKEKETAITASTTAMIKDYQAGKLKSKIKTTDSGLKYIVLKEGTGPQAVAGKTVSVNYAGFLLDGTGFDNSYAKGEPIEFPLGQGAVIRGWDEGLALLKEGAEAMLFIPADLAYGDQGSPPRIPAKAELAFFVELVGVK